MPWCVGFTKVSVSVQWQACRHTFSLVLQQIITNDDRRCCQGQRFPCPFHASGPWRSSYRNQTHRAKSRDCNCMYMYNGNDLEGRSTTQQQWQDQEATFLAARHHRKLAMDIGESVGAATWFTSRSALDHLIIIDPMRHDIAITITLADVVLTLQSSMQLPWSVRNFKRAEDVFKKHDVRVNCRGGMTPIHNI
jgi:hypothetical protein